MKKKQRIISVLTLAISFLVVNHVSALTYQNSTNVDFTINPTISMTLSGDLIIDNLTPGSSGDSNIITVNVSTNASHGYYLSATVGDSSSASSNHNTSLNHSDNSNYKFNSLSSNVSSLSGFSDNQWGYSYCNSTNDCTNASNWISGSQGSTSSGYNGLPLDNDDNGATGVTLVDTTSPLVDSSIKFKIGAKASNTQAAGTYTNTINFYSVSYVTPDAIMQDLNEAWCTTTPSLVQDSRDGTLYHIQRLADGNCWMLDNLAIDLTDPTVQANLTESTTNASNTTLGYLKNGGGSTDSSSPLYKYAKSGVSTDWSGGNSYSIPLINMNSKDTIPIQWRVKFWLEIGKWVGIIIIVLLRLAHTAMAMELMQEQAPVIQWKIYAQSDGEYQPVAQMESIESLLKPSQESLAIFQVITILPTVVS